MKQRRTWGVRLSLRMALVIGVLAASCTGTGGTTTSTTSATTTSRAAQQGEFVPDRPDAEVGGRYLSYATLILPDTAWTQEAMGAERWFRMLDTGALAACASYHRGLSTIEAMRTVMNREEVPLQEEAPSSEDVDAYDLLSAIFIGGIDAYCPDLIETIYGSLFGIGFDEAWEDLTGGPAPDRPIRLPGN